MIKSLFCTLALMFSIKTVAAPKAVILIRHAEDPADESTNPHLSAEGYDRANNLYRLFDEHVDLIATGKPDFLFAAAPQKASGSLRSIETLEPLAKRLNLNLNTDYTKDETSDLVYELFNNDIYNNKVIMISWQHKNMPKIVKHMGFTIKLEYPKNRYDRLWIMKFTKGKPTNFKDISQYLMRGDKD